LETVRFFLKISGLFSLWSLARAPSFCGAKLKKVAFPGGFPPSPCMGTLVGAFLSPLVVLPWPHLLVGWFPSSRVPSCCSLAKSTACTAGRGNDFFFLWFLIRVRLCFLFQGPLPPRDFIPAKRCITNRSSHPPSTPGPQISKGSPTMLARHGRDRRSPSFRFLSPFLLTWPRTQERDPH